VASRQEIGEWKGGRPGISGRTTPKQDYFEGEAVGLCSLKNHRDWGTEGRSARGPLNYPGRLRIGPKEGSKKKGRNVNEILKGKLPSSLYKSQKTKKTGKRRRARSLEEERHNLAKEDVNQGKQRGPQERGKHFQGGKMRTEACAVRKTTRGGGG